MVQRSALRRGFTLVEAMVALTITGVAASALLLSAASATQTTDENARQFVAAGMAQGLLDEIAGMRYMERGADPYQASLGPGSDETIGPGRSKFDDVDDYVGVGEQPPKDRNGQLLGNENGDTTARDPRFRVPSSFFTRWRLESTVFYANETALRTPLSSSTSSYRTTRVRVRYNDATKGWIDLSTLYRTFTYVPEP